MKKIILFLLVVCFVGIDINSAQAQNVLDGVYVKEHAQFRRVVPFAHLREADVMWSKRIWRVIDLDEKLNLPFRYPASKSMADRASLIDVIMDAVEEGTLTAYSSIDDEFTLQLTKDEIEKVGGAGVDSTQITDPDPPYLTRDTVIKREFSRDKVIAYRIKEDWFFDKQRSVIESRLIGIAPMMYAEDDQGEIREGNIRIPLFWIYYPEARNMLVNAEVYNRGNDAERRTYDDVFQKRMFNSYIFKESNVFDRRIEEYKTGIDALLEAERIKHEIINLEHDLWEF
ncbi:MAG: gliding motility protein GldN [Bacteroidia bacterium]|nr:gliding motility protein GldN [Bacteroidia bacterium]NNC85677.1 gliding motility protein GldN [Bacteroidia bacterium]NNM15135.1 gliding motility protein GldN [Bacteroidia bacterium]